MDQYVSWNLSSNELTLETIWGKYEDYCKPQSNEVQARFNILMCFRQGNHSIDKWYNAVQVQVNLTKYPLERAKILHRDIFWFFLKDEDFVSRTISDRSIDLDKFPASRAWQLPKKLKSSKATMRHIKQVSGSPRLPRSTCCDIRGLSYLKTDTKRKDLIPNPGQVTTSHVGMNNTKVKYCIGTKETTNHQFQTDQHL